VAELCWGDVRVLLRFVEAYDFLSFGEGVQLKMDSGLTVVTGPNAAGKSNLGRCLDVAMAVLAGADDRARQRLDLYEDAGYEGAGDFSLRLGIDLDRRWERALVRAFVRACFTTSENDPEKVDGLYGPISEWLIQERLDPLWSGVLVVEHHAAEAGLWSAAWEFTDGDADWHVVLAGSDGLQQLRSGRLRYPTSDGGPVSFSEWLVPSKPEEEESLDFRAALLRGERPVDFAVHALPGWIPDSVRVLATRLGISPEDREFTFDQVLSLVLRRGVVLTDNRRLPLSHRFTVAELGEPADLRDGAAVGAELFRLKNGYPADQARYRQIQATFKELTGRELEVRARPAVADAEGGSMVVEPTVRGVHGERLVELSGAGMQEALVLAAVLRDRPGQVTVLDEPAVNLEPTVQRRLIRKFRGQGQYLVITHSADLVPFEEPGDLSRIVRVAPGPGGSQVRQPDFSRLAESDLLRQLRLLVPADVRALLFAAGVILCEGPTEVGALPRWWAVAGPRLGVPDPAAANVPVLSVDGQTGFGAYLRYLRAFGVRWAVVADGPALRPDSKLAGDLRELGCWPDGEPPSDRDDFAGWRDFLAGAGVFTLAAQFGDDNTKSGEFEAFLEYVDRNLFEEAKRTEGRSKPRRGAYFALHHQDPPPEVLHVYSKIARRLGLPGTAEAANSGDTTA
jgi:energy-coupling factor transporter ATP-binding protein EcfA2